MAMPVLEDFKVGEALLLLLTLADSSIRVTNDRSHLMVNTFCMLMFNVEQGLGHDKALSHTNRAVKHAQSSQRCLILSQIQQMYVKGDYNYLCL